jgi:hypothetical protein
MEAGPSQNWPKLPGAYFAPGLCLSKHFRIYWLDCAITNGVPMPWAILSLLAK